MTNRKNKGLIKKSTKNKILKPSTPIKKIQNEDFSYSLHQRTPLLQKKESSKKQQERLSNQKTFSRAALTKDNGKSIKITQEVLEEIQLLGSFINESVIYKIIVKLVKLTSKVIQYDIK